MNESFEEKLHDLSCEDREEWCIERLRDAAHVATREEHRDRFLHMADRLSAGMAVWNIGQTMEYIDDTYGPAIEAAEVARRKEHVERLGC